MAFYLIIFCFVLIFSYSYSKSNDIGIILISKTTAFFLLFIPAALRYGIGTDYFTYVKNFNLIKAGIPIRLEPGWQILNKFCIDFNLDVQWIFVIPAFLTLFFLFLAVPRKSFYLIIPVYFCLFYAFLYNATRNAIPITMFYYALKLFNKRKVIIACIIIVFAALFHYSAFLYIPVFLLLFIKINKKQAELLFFFSVVLQITAPLLVNQILNTIVVSTVFAYHIGTEQAEGVQGVTVHVLVHYLIFGVVIMFAPKIGIKAKNNVFSLFLVLHIVYILGTASLIFHRLNFLFIVAWFSVIHVINTNHYKYRKFLLLAIFFWALSTFIAAVGISGSSGIIPYKTIFQK
jgi:hypothetical protein